MSVIPTENVKMSVSETRTLDLLPLGAILISDDLTIQSWNQTIADWTGLGKEVAVGANLATLFPNVANRRYAERLHQVFSTGMPATYSPAFHKHFLPVPARHGLEDQLMIQQTEVRLFSRESDIALITIQDVSLQYVQLGLLKEKQAALVKTRDELQDVVARLEVSNQDLDDFNYIASHDLQEPLRKIVSFGQLFEQSCPDSLTEDGQQYLAFMRDASLRMKNLISDLLSLSRTSRSQLDYNELELNPCIDDVLQLLGHRIEITQAQIKVPQLPTVVCDRRLIAQLFQNLIGNALKFVADETPHIEVTAERHEGHWILGVKDNGIGIDDASLKRVFQPFHRLHGRGAYEGTGIGLSICKKAVHRHNGEIWVDSKPGEGAHFQFTLPDDCQPANYQLSDGSSER